MVNLDDLLIEQDIVIQCHNIPDADTIAAGYSLFEFFRINNKEARLVFSGPFNITKPNLLAFVSEFDIPIEYVNDLEDDPDLLITVDCQFGARNVSEFNAGKVAVIDHHRKDSLFKKVDFLEIEDDLGSCSTLVWKMLKRIGFDVNEYPNIATALYYGLLTDTNDFTEINHPLDRDMRDDLQVDEKLIRKLRNSNLSLNDIEIAGISLIRCNHIASKQFAVFKAHPCDPNILGFISDLAIKVDSVNTCVVYNNIDNGVKFSVRSCVSEIMANEMAEFLSERIGNGGGHKGKAGGFIDGFSFDKQFPNSNMDAYFMNRIMEYHESFDIFSCSSHGLDIRKMAQYRKKNVEVGAVSSTSCFAEGTPILIRCIEGDTNIISSPDILIMIGVQGEVYPIKREKFEKDYKKYKENFFVQSKYSPSVKNKKTNESINIMEHAASYIPRERKLIYATPISKNTKIFTDWNTDGYMYGRPGDYLAVSYDNTSDIYIIQKDIFELTYDNV